MGNRRYNWFEGKIEWLGKECRLILNCHKDINNYEICLNYFKELYHNMEGFNNNCIEFVVEELFETAIEWNDDNPISKEDFISST